MRDSEIKVIYCATEKQINQLLEQESWRVVSSSACALTHRDSCTVAKRNCRLFEEAGEREESS